MELQEERGEKGFFITALIGGYVSDTRVKELEEMCF